MKRFSILILILISGTVIAWTSIVSAFIRFYNQEGTLLKIQDCYYPNPVTTPCFWGGLAFLGALVWVLYLSQVRIARAVHQQLGYLRLFLVGATIFGFSNVTYELYVWFFQGHRTVGCTAGTNIPPWQGACLYGSILFLLGFLVVYGKYIKK